MQFKHDHLGHRQRLRDRYNAGGINALFDYEILEMLLNQIILYSDTQSTAKNLLAKFGTVKKVLAADLDQLANVQGVGKRTASMLNFFGRTFYYLYRDQIANRSTFSRVEIANICYEAFRGKNYECMVYLCYDRCVELCHSGETTDYYKGGIRISPSLEEIIDEAKAHRARYIYFAHNHPPESVAHPSNIDLDFIKKSIDLTMRRDIIILDHAITCGADTFSSFYSNALGRLALGVATEIGPEHAFSEKFIKENFFNHSGWDNGHFNKHEMVQLIRCKFDPILP